MRALGSRRLVALPLAKRRLSGETEYYDLSRDPYELESRQISGTYKGNLDRLLRLLRNCQGAECRRAEGG